MPNLGYDLKKGTSLEEEYLLMFPISEKYFILSNFFTSIETVDVNKQVDTITTDLFNKEIY